MASVHISLDLKGTSWNTDVPASGALITAVCALLVMASIMMASNMNACCQLPRKQVKLVNAEGSIKEAVMSAKQQTMERINEYMAQNKQDPKAADEVNVMEEEVPADVDDGEDEIQQLAGEASHKPKKRKTGF